MLLEVGHFNAFEKPKAESDDLYPPEYYKRTLESGFSNQNFIRRLIVRNFNTTDCVKSACIRSYSGPYPVQMRENTDQNNYEYGHFSHSEEEE